MRTVNEVSKLSGVSIRTLHYYDNIGLLHPTMVTEAGYRLLENLITFARGIQGVGVRNMDFSAFDAKKIDEYAAQAKATWGKTEAYKEYEKKTEGLSDEQKSAIGANMMELFVEFGKLRDMAPESEAVQQQVKKLQDYITEHYYTCTNQILAGLGKMYVGGGAMTENIDEAGGSGTAEIVAKAIEIYCR